jgi:hypothetical protein
MMATCWVSARVSFNSDNDIPMADCHDETAKHGLVILVRKSSRSGVAGYRNGNCNNGPSGQKTGPGLLLAG